TQTGRYTGTLVWDDPAIDLDLYLTSPGCPYPPTSCLLSVSDAVGTISEAVTRSVVAGQAFRLYVDNFTNKTTAFTIQNVVAPAEAADPVAGPGSSTGTPAISKIKPFQ